MRTDEFHRQRVELQGFRQQFQRATRRSEAAMKFRDSKESPLGPL